MPLLDQHHICACQHHGPEGFTSAGVQRHYPPDLGVEPHHLDIDLRLDIPGKRCEGTVTLSVKARRDGADALQLDAVDFEDLSVTDAEGHALSWSYDGKKIEITWAEGLSRDAQRRVVVGYKITSPAAGLYFSSPSEAYPEAARYAATDHETERARHWLPCIDLPNVRTTLDFRLRADADFTILANGIQKSDEAHDDGTHTVHYHLDWPCPSYLVCFAIGDFTRKDDGEFEGLELSYFCSREHTPDDLQRSFGRTGAMLAWMTKKLDFPFPFPKYFQFALPGYGGAMENISLVSWDDIFVLDETLALEWTWLVDQINVHEMAHSYFGDAVVCREFAHAWLKESWATYMEACWLEDSKGADEHRYDMYSNAHAYFSEADGNYKRPIVTREYNTSWDMYDRHLYPGGACRLHTLRCELGDEVFWGAVRDYLKIHAGQVVETEDFRKVMEAHSGRSLVRFFEQWLYSPGYPSLKVSFAYDSKTKLGTFEVEQTQVDEKAGVPLFDLNIELAWFIDGERHTMPAHLTKARHVFMATMEKDPAMVRVDPDGKVLHKLELNPGDGKLRTQLTDSKDVVGRILAAVALGETSKRANLQAIRDAYTAEPFWGVRVRFVQALATAATDASAGHVAEIVGLEEDPMVMEHAFRAAGALRDARIKAALETRLDGELPYRARMAALEALGLQRNPDAVDRLETAARTEGFGGFAQSGGARGLAYTRHRAAAETLGSLAALGASSNRARPAIVGALATIGTALDDREQAPVVEQLVDLLRDPNERVCWAAAKGLRALKATSAIGALSAYANTLPAQEKVDADRLVAAILSDAKPKSAALEKQLEEARDTIRKLEGRLTKIEARFEVDEKAE